MKKLFRMSIFLILIMTIFAVSGCSGQSAAGDSESADLKDEKMNLTLLGASPNGPGLIIMNGLAECINKSYPDSIVTIVPGNNGTNVTRINNNEADLAMTDNVFAAAASQGQYPYDKKMENLAAVAVMNPQVFQVVADSDLGIDSFDEIIKNKMKIRISSGLAGGAWPLFFKNYLAEYGLTINDMTNWGCEILYQGIDDSAKMLADDRIDVFICSVFIPTPTIQELSQSKKIVLLNMDSQVLNRLCEKHGYQKTVITSSIYDFVGEDILSINTNSILIVPKDSPEDKVYKITQSIDSNLDYLKTVHSSFAAISSDSLIKNLDMPLHPGAEKYYREEGIIK